MDSPIPEDTVAPPASLSGETSALLQEGLGLLHSWLQLLELETRQTAGSLVNMMGTGILLALLLAATWFCVVGAAVLGLVETGLNASLAMLLAAGANAALAWLSLRQFRKQEHKLGWAASLRGLSVWHTARQDPPG